MVIFRCIFEMRSEEHIVKFIQMAIVVSLISPAYALEPLQVVAAENFYGDLVKQVGGSRVSVTSVLNNPDQDPHLFEASPSIARNLNSAVLIIVNGIGYDAWMDKLVPPSKSSSVINVAKLNNKKDGENPHIWYDVSVMQKAADEICARLSFLEPSSKPEFERNLALVQADLGRLQTKIEAVSTKTKNKAITATEPVFGYMAAALHLEMRNERFQLAVMNNTEPSFSDVTAFEADIKNHKVRALLYNSQASSPTADRLKKLAGKFGIPVVGITETEPENTKYQDWMMSQVIALETEIAK